MFHVKHKGIQSQEEKMDVSKQTTEQKDTEQKFTEQLSMIGLDLSRDQLQQFRMYYENCSVIHIEDCISTEFCP